MNCVHYFETSLCHLCDVIDMQMDHMSGASEQFICSFFWNAFDFRSSSVCNIWHVAFDSFFWHIPSCGNTKKTWPK